MKQFALTIFCLFLAWASQADAQGESRQALTLAGTWSVETSAPDPVQGAVWRVEATGAFQGGSFIQFRAFPLIQVKGCVDRKDTSGICKRLRIRANKPTDKVGSLALQFPGRSVRVTAAAGVPYGEILLNELSMEDYGLMALQLVVEGATDQSFGAINVRSHDQDLPPVALAALTSNGQVLRDGDAVPAGWWFLFFGSAKEVNVVEDPTDLISLCAFLPTGKIRCADTNQMDLRITKRGSYLFVAWNKQLQASVISIQGV